MEIIQFYCMQKCNFHAIFFFSSSMELYDKKFLVLPGDCHQQKQLCMKSTSRKDKNFFNHTIPYNSIEHGLYESGIPAIFHTTDCFIFLYFILKHKNQYFCSSFFKILRCLFQQILAILH